MKYVIVSGFTPNPIYEEKAFKLASTLNDFNLNYEIVQMEERGSWIKNCQQKAEVILDALNRYKKPVVWLDADAEVKQNPSLFNTLAEDICDIAYYAMPRPNRHLASGTLFFGNTSNARAILEHWIYACSISQEYDQKILQDILWDSNLRPVSKFDIIELPVEYCRIFDNKSQEPYLRSEPVIIHTQASRLIKAIYKKVDVIGKSVLICGNGGSLPKHIESINLDDYDFICRLNNYKASKEVGLRTDIWATSFWYDITPAQILSNKSKIIWDTFMFGKVYNYQAEWRQKVYSLLNRAPDKIMSQNDFNELRYMSKLTSPSTGISAVHLALLQDMKPTLVGFDFFNPSVQHHYYSGSDTKKCPHKGDNEKAFIEGLEKEGKINVIK